MNDQLITDLKETRRQLEIRGRCASILHRYDGKVCLDGAIIAAVETHPRFSYNELYTPRAKEVIRALVAQLPETPRNLYPAPRNLYPAPRNLYPASRRLYSAIYNFNDTPSTTDADCYNLIDKAIAEAGGYM